MNSEERFYAGNSESAAAPHPSVLRGLVLRSLSDMRRGLLHFELPDGKTTSFGSTAASMPLGIGGIAKIRVHRESFFRKCFLYGDIGFAESFIDGDWSTPDLTAVISWFILNIDEAPTLSGSRKARHLALNLLRGVNRIGHLLRPGSVRKAARNIRAHYDLSNDFFSLFLDPSMMYSSALWNRPGLTLEQAQEEKNARLCRMLRLDASDHVLEIGTGWGGWAIHAAKAHGCRVTTVTLSKEQHAYATERVAAAGLSGRISVRLHDFRLIEGTYDKIVSIEMIEALGHDYLADFCQVVDRSLKRDGLLALQFITCPDSRYEQFRKGVDFIQKHIFPGSLLLSLNRLNEQMSRAGGFVLHGMKDMGQDYALTLRAWNRTFAQRAAEVRALGFDERFVRKWDYYLAYCEAAFALRNISVVQTVHSRANNLSF